MTRNIDKDVTADWNKDLWCVTHLYTIYMYIEKYLYSIYDFVKFVTDKK